MAKKTVVVGISGGVDSSVAAALLKEQGFDVIGLFMHNWKEEQNGACTAAEDYSDAISVCEKLKIPCYSVDFSKEYMDNVFRVFLDEYKKGRTPNPDVLCNREIKFGPFKNYAARLGADFIATGHYCGTDGKFLLKAVDAEKDQTYFLNQLKDGQLNNVLFPLSHLNKLEVRQIAAKYGLVTAKKKDSTGICFIGERNFKDFLSSFLPAQQGEIKDIKGRLLGCHSGLMYYTLGQRRGLNIGGVRGEEQNRWYVVEKDLKTNTLIISNGDGEELLSDALTTEQFNWIGCEPTESEFDCHAKFRYRQAEQGVRIIKQEKALKIIFEKRQRAITPGQYAVLYNNQKCLGGGVINKAIKNIL